MNNNYGLVLKIDSKDDNVPDSPTPISIQSKPIDDCGTNNGISKKRLVKRNKDNSSITYPFFKDYIMPFIESKTKKFLYKEQITATLDKFRVPYKKTEKKPVLQQQMFDVFLKIEKHDNPTDIKKLNIITTIWRDLAKQRKFRIYGPGFIDKTKCKNTEDFLTFETVDDIDDKYFFSIKDSYGSIFFFDIRTFNKLISRKDKNPYTREDFSEEVIELFENRKEYMVSNDISMLFQEDIEHLKNLTPEEKINNRVLAIFQIIDELNVIGGGTRLEWFNNLSIIQLKNYYKVLEDIWNYRANLTSQQKVEICQDKQMFSISVSAICSLHQPIKIKNIILNEMETLITTSDNINHRHTGAYYTLIAFTEISSECAQDMPWLIQY